MGVVRPRRLDDVPGWFNLADRLVMDWILRYQRSVGLQGDLLEMGAYLGKSAIVIGGQIGPGERFVVCDLFGTDAQTPENERTARFYRTLTREAFETNYLAFHEQLPEIIQAPSSVLRGLLAPAGFRFVHVDACHHYRHVREDLHTACELLAPGGMVVFDDIRTAHTPGVAAAVWPEVDAGRLQVVCLTPNKLYAGWGDVGAVREAVRDWLANEPRLGSAVDQVCGQQLVRIWPTRVPSPTRSRIQQFALDILPPLLVRQLKRIPR
jgi:hypothetical protein